MFCQLSIANGGSFMQWWEARRGSFRIQRTPGFAAEKNWTRLLLSDKKKMLTVLGFAQIQVSGVLRPLTHATLGLWACIDLSTSDPQAHWVTSLVGHDASVHCWTSSAQYHVQRSCPCRPVPQPSPQLHISAPCTYRARLGPAHAARLPFGPGAATRNEIKRLASSGTLSTAHGGEKIDCPSSLSPRRKMSLSPTVRGGRAIPLGSRRPGDDERRSRGPAGGPSVPSCQ